MLETLRVITVILISVSTRDVAAQLPPWEREARNRFIVYYGSQSVYRNSGNFRCRENFVASTTKSQTVKVETIEVIMATCPRFILRSPQLSIILLP